jgi:hypothetical protein
VYELNGYGSLGAASLVWGACLSLIQRIGESLCYRMGACVAMPLGPKESTRWRPGTPVAEENDMDWALKDIPGTSLVIPNL